MKTLIAVFALAVATGLSWAARPQDQPGTPMPAQEHAFLKQYEGTWESSLKLRHAPEAAWMDCTGTMEARMIGDFWVTAEWKMDSAGMPMQGVQTIGFDPVKKKYVVTWISHSHPALALGEGRADGRSLATDIRSTDCATGRPVEARMTEVFKDDDTLVWSMKKKDRDGKEFETMRGEAKRRK